MHDESSLLLLVVLAMLLENVVAADLEAGPVENTGVTTGVVLLAIVGLASVRFLSHSLFAFRNCCSNCAILRFNCCVLISLDFSFCVAVFF